MNDIRDASLVARNTEAKLVRRPVSPHIGIYRWPITMFASILNRATGIALSVGSLLLVWWLVAAATGPQEFARVQAFIASPVGLVLLLGWDTGRGLSKPSLNPMTWVILALTALGTAGVWVAGYIVMAGA